MRAKGEADRDLHLFDIAEDELRSNSLFLAFGELICEIYLLFRLYLLPINRTELHLSFLCCAEKFYGQRENATLKDLLSLSKSPAKKSSKVIKLIEHAIKANGFRLINLLFSIRS